MSHSLPARRTGRLQTEHHHQAQPASTLRRISVVLSGSQPQRGQSSTGTMRSRRGCEQNRERARSTNRSATVFQFMSIPPREPPSGPGDHSQDRSIGSGGQAQVHRSTQLINPSNTPRVIAPTIDHSNEWPFRRRPKGTHPLKASSSDRYGRARMGRAGLGGSLHSRSVPGPQSFAACGGEGSLLIPLPAPLPLWEQGPGGASPPDPPVAPSKSQAHLA